MINLNSKKTFILVTSMSILLLTTAFHSSMENDKKEYEQAIELAERLFPSLNLERTEYKLIAIENMVIKGKFEGFHIWSITFKLKGLFSKEGLIGAGGEVFIRVDVENKKAILQGYGE